MSLHRLIELIRGLIGQSDDGFRGCGALDELKVAGLLRESQGVSALLRRTGGTLPTATSGPSSPQLSLDWRGQGRPGASESLTLAPL